MRSRRRCKERISGAPSASAPSWGMLGWRRRCRGRSRRAPSGDRRRGAASLRARGLSMAWRPRLVSMPIISMIWRRRPTSSASEVEPSQVPEEAVLVDARARRKGRSPPRRACVGLGQAAHRAGEVSDLAWLLTTQSGNPNASQGRRNGSFEAASRSPVQQGRRTVPGGG